MSWRERLKPDFAFGLTRQNDADCSRVLFHHVREKLGPVHLRHPHIADNDIERSAGHDLKRGGSPGCELDVPFFAVAAQLAPQCIQNERIIIDEKQRLFHTCAALVESGRRIVNVVPCPGSLSRWIAPPCCCLLYTSDAADE